MNKRKRYVPHYVKKTPTNRQCLKPEKSSRVPIDGYNFAINLFASRCRIRKTGCTTAKISKYHILESENTGEKICCNILNTDIGLNGRYKNINFNIVTSILSRILEKFRIRHNRFNYHEELKYIIARDSKKYANKTKYKNQIHRRSLQSFFNSLLRKTVPPELFETSQNFKVVKRTIGRLLRTVPKNTLITRAFKRTIRRKNVIGASLSMQPLFNKFDIFKIEWLHLINNNTVRWIIVLKLLRWFFAQYIIKILHKHVVLTSVKNQWVYIAKDDWFKMELEKISSCGLVPWTRMQIDERKFNIPIGTYKFIPSSSGLRALLIAKYNIKERYDKVDVGLRFLQQLYVTYFNKNGLPTIISCKEEVFKFKASTKNRLYYVRCDIQDAFGSIIQEKLYKIIITYCRQLEKSYIVLRTYTMSKNRRKIQTVQFLSYYLKTILGKKAVMNRKKPVLVKMTKLMAIINKLIFEQKVKIDSQVYLIKHGVPQGMRISPILSDIYYQDMINEIFPAYENNGLLCRYVDDILYITENEHYATEFLKIIRNGIPEYNVKFNPSKIQSNIESPCNPIKIKFLGFNIKL